MSKTRVISAIKSVGPGVECVYESLLSRRCGCDKTITRRSPGGLAGSLWLLRGCNSLVRFVFFSNPLGKYMYVSPRWRWRGSRKPHEGGRWGRRLLWNLPVPHRDRQQQQTSFLAPCWSGGRLLIAEQVSAQDC